MFYNKQSFFSKNFLTPLTTKKATLIIIAVGIIVFLNSLFNNFVEDDLFYIVNYSPIHQLNIHFLFGGNLFNELGQYRPISATYFSLLYTLFGSSPFFYHFFQLSIHIINTILLYLILSFLFVTINETIKKNESKNWDSLSGSEKIKYQRTRGVPFNQYSGFNQKTNIIALFLSLIFLIHPINVESVSYIGASQSVLFFLFGILALWIGIRKNVYLKSLLIVSGFLLLSILTKETGILFLFVLLFYSLLFARNNLFKFSIMGLITLIVYAFFRLSIGHIGLATRHFTPIAKLPLAERLLNIPLIILYYLKTFAFPNTLVYYQEWIIRFIDFQNFYFPLIIDCSLFALLVLFGIFIYKCHKQYLKLFLFFSFWFVVGLLFHIQIFPLDITVADRWMYFPFVGLLGILGVIADIIINNSMVKRVTIIGGVIILIFLSLRTIERNTNFYDDMTLLTHDSKILDNGDIENNLASDFFQKKNYNEALKHYQKAVEFQPTFDELFNLGVIYEITNKNNSNVIHAREAFFKMLDYDVNDYSKGMFDDDFTLASSNLLFNDNLIVTRKYITLAIQKVPDSWRLYSLLAWNEYELHNLQAAIIAAEKAKSIHPSEQTNLLYTLISQKKELPLNLIYAFQPQ